MKYFIFVTYRPIVNLSNNMLVYKLLNVPGDWWRVSESGFPWVTDMHVSMITKFSIY